jgi:CRISPR-associated protein (TIGR03985 family)
MGNGMGNGIDSGAALWDTAQSGAVLQTLDRISQILPECTVLVDQMWTAWVQHAQGLPTVQETPAAIQWEPEQRIFLHLDYVLPEDDRDRVDDYQAQLTALWQQERGVIAFQNWLARQERAESVITYPVCLHYVRRAKYLTGYGVQADGALGWHNYRMDRIRSARLKVLPWGDRAIPLPLQRLHDRGQLPTSEAVQAALDAAWGFNFYLPRAWLLIRFPAWFARGYVDRTERHPTFAPIAYTDIPRRVRQVGLDAAAQGQVLGLVQRRSPTDTYYQGWMRVGDITLQMRLRDWRPLGETLAPMEVRDRMIKEAEQELAQYRQ